MQRLNKTILDQILKKLEYECRPFIRTLSEDSLISQFVKEQPDTAFHSFFSPRFYQIDYRLDALTQNQNNWIKSRIKRLGEILVRTYGSDSSYSASARFVAQALEGEKEYPNYPSRPLSLIEEKEYISYMGSTDSEPQLDSPNMNWYQSNRWDNWIKIHENKQVE